MPPCPGSGVHTAAIHLAKAVGRFQRSAIDQSAAIARGRHPSRPPLASSHWELFGISICPSAPLGGTGLAAAAPPQTSPRRPSTPQQHVRARACDGCNVGVQRPAAPQSIQSSRHGDQRQPARRQLSEAERSAPFFRIDSGGLCWHRGSDGWALYSSSQRRRAGPGGGASPAPRGAGSRAHS